MMSKATIQTFLDTRASKAGTGIVKLLLTYQREQRLFSLGIKVDTSDWKKLQESIGKDGLSGKVKNQKLIELYNQIYGTYRDNLGEHDGALVRGKRVIERLGSSFSFDKFRQEFKNFEKKVVGAENQNDVIQALMQKSQMMREEDRVGNASNYELAAKSLMRFLNEMDNETRTELNLPLIPKYKTIDLSKITFEEVSPQFLKKYERWMLRCGKLSQKAGSPSSPASITTIGIYLRHVKAVFKDKTSQNYPFGKGKYIIPSGESTKKALSSDDIYKVLSYVPEAGTMEERGHDLWIFSYLGNGMNFADICRLKWSDMDEKEKSFSFIREKTKRTQITCKRIKVYLRPKLEEIIKRWSKSILKKNPNEYIFPFIDDTMDAKRKKAVIHQVTKMTNKWMNKIAQRLEIEGDVTTYSARHSFATMLLRGGTPAMFISKSLGHSNLQTLDPYLGEFEKIQAHNHLKNLEEWESR